MKYSVTFTGSDWVLKIWEPALPSHTRTIPLLYKVQLRFPTEAEAMAMLEEYKQFYNMQAWQLAIA